MADPVSGRLSSSSAVVRDSASVVYMGDSMVEYELGGRRYPYKSSARCRVCQSPSRMQIEDGILVGRTYTAILRSLPVDLTEGEDAISKATLANHAEKHMPLDAVIARQVVEQKTADMGRSIETAMGSMMDHHILATEIVRRVGERVARGELKPNLDHAIGAMKYLFDEDARTDGGAEKEMADEMLTELMVTINQVLDPADLRAIGARLRHSPKWVAFMMRQTDDVSQDSLLEISPSDD